MTGPAVTPLPPVYEPCPQVRMLLPPSTLTFADHQSWSSPPGYRPSQRQRLGGRILYRTSLFVRNTAQPVIKRPATHTDPTSPLIIDLITASDRCGRCNIPESHR
jgi:hypothetical protein